MAMKTKVPILRDYTELNHGEKKPTRDLSSHPRETG